MASPVLSVRLPKALNTLLTAKATETGLSRSDIVLDMLTEALSGFRTDPAPGEESAPARARPPAPPKKARRVSKVVAPAPAADEKAEAARGALAAAEARTGVRSAMDSLPVGQVRAPYQRARDKR